MTAAPLGTVLQHLRKLADVRRAAELPDAQLLERFAARRDQAAFAAVLERHGPAVWGVCRRILGNEADAEDAFQATFLVLVRKAGSIGKGESLGYWLYEVAYRTALRARSSATRRRERERRAPTMADTEPLAGRAWDDLRPLLDEELHRLPEKYRRPFVLCYLEGKTHAQAAAQLGWPKGTVSGRLARARDALRRRLARQGVTLSAGTLLGASAHAAAAVPAALRDTTLRAALQFASGGAAGPFASAEAVTLAQGVLEGMVTSKLKLALVALLALAALGGGTAGLAWHAGSARGAPPAPANRPQPAAEKPAPEADRLPAGATARLGTVDLRHGDHIFFVAFTPDGKKLVTAGRDGTVRLWDAGTGKEQRRFERPDLPPEKVPGGGGVVMRFGGPDIGGEFLATLSPDGKTLAATRGGIIYLWDVATGKELHRLKGPLFGGAALAFVDGGKA